MPVINVGTRLADGEIETSGLRRETVREVTNTPDAPPPTREYEFANCGDVDVSAGQSHYLCGLPPDEQHEALECTDDQTVSTPQYSRSRTINADGSRGPWGPWQWNDTFRCVDPEGPTTTDIRTILERDLATLPIPPSPLNVQPDQDWTYVNLDTIVFTDPEPTVLTTTVLGTSVEVRVTPVSFAWNFGDGSDPLVTSDPGKPYPDHTVAYAYPTTGDYTITLTTTWEGAFRLTSGATWEPIAGSTTTTTTRDPMSLVERRTRLVTNP
ncbi:PKD domain-containing protein [Flavimobilis marinus]|uniref:PKD domain-containing protein n=1 Tax=Flavimobilis marinus TaxID=285351 RepID=UPI001671D616|nr:PKD domain-containing protein [Flavimobilis marinus]